MKEKREAKIEVVYDYLHRADEKAGRCGTVWVRLYYNRRRRYWSTGVMVLPSQWSDRYGVIHHERADELNAAVEAKVEEVRAMVRKELKGKKRTDELGGVMKRGRRKKAEDATFWAWCEAAVGEMRVSEGTRKGYRATLNAVRAWGGLQRFEDVTPEGTKAFVKYARGIMVRRCDEEGRVVMRPTSDVHVYDHFKRVRHLVRLAQEARLVALDALVGVRCERGRNVEREALTDDEVERWRGAVLPNGHLREVRDLFTVQMGTGLSYGDLMGVDFTRHVRYEGRETLRGRRQKTGEAYFVVILPMAVEVLERWGWKVKRISNQRYNDYLGAVARAAGIEKHVTSHVARHTYATRCLAHGVRLEAVQRTLGHSSIKTTQIYAKMVDRAVIEAFEGMKWK